MNIEIVPAIKNGMLLPAVVFIIAGNYAGDYQSYRSLERCIEIIERGNLFVWISKNVQIVPLLQYFSKGVSSFPVITDGTFREKIFQGFLQISILPNSVLSLTGDYYFITNYMYFDDFFIAKQESVTFNLLHVGAEKARFV